MSSELFWNKPFKKEAERAVDPLGFDALREAMADVLVPWLTGGTSHAEDYVAILVGLRWAAKQASPPVDKSIWEKFARFERGLKLAWFKSKARIGFTGKNRVSDLCDSIRPNLDAPILEDQRGNGLLGLYLASMRSIGLVEKGSLKVNEAVARRVVDDDLVFSGSKLAPSSWDEIKKRFTPLFPKNLRPHAKRLGPLLFGGELQGAASNADALRMKSAALAVISNRDAESWNDLKKAGSLDPEQKRIAGACAALVDLENCCRRHFKDMLQGKQASELTKAERSEIKVLASKALGLHPIPANWSNQNMLATHLTRAMGKLADGKEPLSTLLALHKAVVQEVRHNEPWLDQLGLYSPIKIPSGGKKPDFRLGNLEKLLRETRWRP